jgi:anthranilate phosphoribosyltransferase
MDVERALVVHGDGLDEICLHGETVAAEVNGADVTQLELAPEDFGLDRAPVGDISGGTPEDNATDLRAIVEGDETGPKRDVILANAGAAIYVAGEADGLEAGAERALTAIESGDAAAKLSDLCDGA